MPRSTAPNGERTSARQKQERADQAGEREIVEPGLGRRSSVMPNGPGRRGMPASPSEAPVTRRPLEGDGIEQLRECQRQHGERHAGRERAHPATPIATTPLNSAASEHGEQHRHVGVQQQIARGVGAEAVGRGVAEREQPRVADHQVEAHGEQPEDQSLGQQRHGERRQARAGRAISSATPTRPSSAEPAHAHHASLPSRPPGRTTSTSSMIRYMKASARSGK